MNEETSIAPITDLLEDFIIPDEVTAAQTANLKKDSISEQKEQVPSP